MVGIEFINVLPAYVPLVLGAIFTYGLLLYFIKKTKRYRLPFDRYFILGFIIMVTAVGLVFLRLFRIIESNIYTYYAFHIGLMIEAILFTISLAGRYNKISKERATGLKKELQLSQKNTSLQTKLISQLQKNELLQTKVQRELENKVQERTIELKEKNEELDTFNKNLADLINNLEEMNIHLDKSNWQLKRDTKTATKDRFFKQTTCMGEISKGIS